MRPIQVTNSLARQKETLVPRTPGEISMYVCGVTPYDQSHLGHARPAVVFDVIRRYLRLKGYKVRLVQNFTDVDDKIIAHAARDNEDPLALADRYCREYLSSMDSLGVQRADVYPKVSEHIPDIVKAVAELVEKGAAYPVDGDVFFSVDSFPDYGKLSNQKRDELLAGTRFEVDERKRNPLDFALWKAAKPGEPAWPSPWGMGRPGWHIECSVMSLKYLGNQFDIHGGGIDIIFPHHENEVAQSEALTGQPPFVRYWLHNGLVNYEGEKMSKSLGNFLSLEDALARYPAQLLRYYILSHHYRTPVDFAPQRLEAARKAWERLTRVVWEMRQAGVQPSWPGLAAVWSGAVPMRAEASELGSAVYRAADKLDEAMADDFNTAAAIGVLFELANQVAPALRQKASDPGLQQAMGFFDEALGELFGVLAEPQQEIDSGLTTQLIELLVEVRSQARQRKDWATADLIRTKLAELGIILEDTAEGTRWSL